MDAVGGLYIESKDDVPLRVDDPEYALKSYKERYERTGPVLKKMIDDCRAQGCQQVNFSPTGEASFGLTCNTFMGAIVNPPVLDGTLKIETKIAAKVKALCDRNGVRPLAFVTTPKDFVMGGELDTTCQTWPIEPSFRLKDALAAGGIPAVNLADTVRLIDPVLFPMWTASDGHMPYSGQHWIAFAMAWHYLHDLAPLVEAGAPKP